MIAYKKQRRKVDPVKQILARLEEKQSKSGLSLYSRDDRHEPGKEDVLPVVKPFTDASASSKSSPFFPDLSAARQKAHRRLNAGLKHSIAESDRKAALYAQTKADRRLNLTFPPVNAHHATGNVNHGRQSYAFSGWSDSPSAGVENLRNSHNTSMNPFGYSRRTLAFQPTSLNYVVEWPETWPLKIMSIGKGTGRLNKKKPKAKPQNFHRVHFENSPVPCTSPEGPKNGIAKQTSDVAMAAPPQNQSNQVLPEMQAPQTSLSTDSALPQLPNSKKIQQEKQEEQSPSRGEDVSENVTSNLLEAGDRNSTENSRVYSDTTSSLSEGVYVGTYENKTSEVPVETDNQQAHNTTKLSSVPPCTPTSKSIENASKEGKGGDLQECEGREGGADSQSLLMEIVSEIAAEPGADFMQDI